MKDKILIVLTMPFWLPIILIFVIWFAFQFVWEELAETDEIKS